MLLRVKGREEEWDERTCLCMCIHLDSMPSGVTFREPMSIARAIPGASRSITSLVAWGRQNTHIYKQQQVQKPAKLTFRDVKSTSILELNQGEKVFLQYQFGKRVLYYLQVPVLLCFFFILFYGDMYTLYVINNKSNNIY